MVLRKEVVLPKISELETQEVNVSAATLISASPYLGKACEGVNSEFMLCRLETNDPRACIHIGKHVTECAMQVFKKIKKNCMEEFNQYARCIDKSSGDFAMQYCRKTQEVFDDCMLQKLCMERPHYGYFCRGRIHTTTRAPMPPPPCPCQPTVPDPTPSLPDCKPRPPPRFGGRYFWMTE